MTVKAVVFVAKSGTGKTTLLEKTIPRLKERGYKVGALKHDAHRFEIDVPGKDSYRFTVAGADVMVISSAAKTALVERHSDTPPVEDLLSRFFSGVDIVLVEGFGKSALPKIEVHRAACGDTLLCRGAENDPSLLAVASDAPLALDVPVLDIDDPEAVADFIDEHVLKRGRPAPDPR
jgi:molybdopterin-guanine dinucleotide biosynthesis protein MobB